MVEQMVRSDAEKTAAQEKKASQKAAQGKQKPKKGKPSRPKGSKNKNKTTVTLHPELLRIHTMMQKLLPVIGALIPLQWMVLDGHFGNHPAFHMVRSCGLHVLAKLRHDAALSFPYEGPSAGRGPRRKYGTKID